MSTTSWLIHVAVWAAVSFVLTYVLTRPDASTASEPNPALLRICDQQIVEIGKVLEDSQVWSLFWTSIADADSYNQQQIQSAVAVELAVRGWNASVIRGVLRHWQPSGFLERKLRDDLESGIQAAMQQTQHRKIRTPEA